MTKKAFHLFVVLVALIVYGACTACSTVHKILHTKHEVVDSTTGHRSDSTATHEFKDSSNYLYLNDADITVEIGKDTIKGVDTFNSKTIQAIHDVVKAVSGNRVPTRVSIHVGKIVDSSHVRESKDSVRVLVDDTAHLKKNTTVVDKNIKRTSWTMAIIVGAIVLIVFLIIKFFPIISKFFLCLLLIHLISQTQTVPIGSQLSSQEFGLSPHQWQSSFIRPRTCLVQTVSICGLDPHSPSLLSQQLSM